MNVADFYDDFRAITAYADEDQNFAAISDAVDVLCKKGNFNGQIGYLLVPISGAGVIRLPRDVEVPLKVNLSGIPAFARDKFWEFTQNGPGSDEPRLNWQWEDRMFSPLIIDPTYPVQLRLENTNLPDDGLILTVMARVVGADNDANSMPRPCRFTLDSTKSFQIGPIVSEITAIHKPVTTNNIYLTNNLDGSTLTWIWTDDTEPRYRMIKVSATSGVARIMFRRTAFKVRNMNDFVPVDSKRALLLMAQSIRAWNNEKTDLAATLEKEAIAKANEEQQSLDAFVGIASDQEKAGMLNLGINNRDVAIVADIYDEVSEIVGPIGRQKVFDEITKAAQILSNKNQWDAQRGVVDIVTDQYHYVTLPRYVDSVLALNINRRVATPQNKWFEFNRIGQSSLGQQDWQVCCREDWVDLEPTVTLRDLLYTVKLGVTTDLTDDLGVQVRVYGYYQGKRVMTPDASGQNVDGALIPVTADATPGGQNFDRIERITKTATKGFVKLISYDINAKNPVTLGYYWPDETEPNYRRIRINRTCGTARIMYRRKELKFTSLTDPLHLKVGSAVVEQVRAKYLRIGGKLKDAKVAENLALEYLNDEQAITNQNNIPELMFDDSMIVRYV